MIGNACANPTAPVHTVLPVICQTWNITATTVIWPPNPENNRPTINRRNTPAPNTPPNPPDPNGATSSSPRASTTTPPVPLGSAQHEEAGGRPTGWSST